LQFDDNLELLRTIYTDNDYFDDVINHMLTSFKQKELNESSIYFYQIRFSLFFALNRPFEAFYFLNRFVYTLIKNGGQEELLEHIIKEILKQPKF